MLRGKKMEKKENCKVEFFEDVGKIVLYDYNASEEDFEIEGDVYFNHDLREVRIYNFKKSYLTEEEKSKIIFSILKSECLFPNYLKSKNNSIGDIAQYTLLINGYLLDGSFKKIGKKYKTIIEEFVESSEESEEFSSIKYKIKYFYDRYEDVLGKETVNIFLTNKGIIKGFIEYINFVDLFAAYLKSKGRRFRVITNNKIWIREKKVIILPY
jgi:hypothetical protein